MQINEVPKFLAGTTSETTHTLELVNPFNTAHPFIILLQLSGVSSFFDAYSSNMAEYMNDDISMIHLTAEENLWDPSTKKYSDRKTNMLNH